MGLLAGPAGSAREEAGALQGGRGLDEGAEGGSQHCHYMSQDGEQGKVTSTLHPVFHLPIQKTSPGKVGQLAENIYQQMFGEINIDRADITRLYTDTPGLSRGNVQVFLQIGLNGVNIGRIEIQLRYDVVPRYLHPKILKTVYESSNSFI